MNSKVQELVRWQGCGTRRSYPQAVLKRLALQKLHDDEGLALVLLYSVNRADVGVIESRSCLGLPLESLQVLSVLGEFFRQELQGDGALELGVLGLVHHAHTATTQLLQDAVVRNGLANHGEGPAFGGHLRPRLQPSQRAWARPAPPKKQVSPGGETESEGR